MTIEETFENINIILNNSKNDFSKMFNIYPKKDFFNNFVRKWEPVLDSPSLGKIQNRKLTAWLLEEQFLLNKGYKEDSNLLVEELTPLQNISLPIIRRLTPSLKFINLISPYDQYVKQKIMTLDDFTEIKIKFPLLTSLDKIHRTAKDLERLNDKEFDILIENITEQLKHIVQPFVYEGKYFISPIIFTKIHDNTIYIRTAVK